MENLTNDTPPKTGFWTPPSYGAFFTPLRCPCSVFPVQKSTTEQTRSSFGGVQKFSGERVLWYVFLPPYVLPPPHITAQLLRISVCNQVSNGNSYRGEPGRCKKSSHCSFEDFHSLSKENQVSLVRTFLSDPG